MVTNINSPQDKTTYVGSTFTYAGSQYIVVCDGKNQDILFRRIENFPFVVYLTDKLITTIKGISKHGQTLSKPR